jgi:hypothetical protein
MKGERLIQKYIDAVRERDSFKPQPGEEQTEARDSKLKQAEHRTKIAYSLLNGSMIGEARRRLEVR